MAYAGKTVTGVVVSKQTLSRPRKGPGADSCLPPIYIYLYIYIFISMSISVPVSISMFIIENTCLNIKTYIHTYIYTVFVKIHVFTSLYVQREGGRTIQKDRKYVQVFTWTQTLNLVDIASGLAPCAFKLSTSAFSFVEGPPSQTLDACPATPHQGALIARTRT